MLRVREGVVASMLSKFSVKRPYIIVVAVIIALILGGVSLSKMKTDLLPDMDIPYLMVMTTDPGASAEKVETEVTEVLESTLSDGQWRDRDPIPECQQLLYGVP